MYHSSYFFTEDFVSYSKNFTDLVYTQNELKKKARPRKGLAEKMIIYFLY